MDVMLMDEHAGAQYRGHAQGGYGFAQGHTQAAANNMFGQPQPDAQQTQQPFYPSRRNELYPQSSPMMGPYGSSAGLPTPDDVLEKNLISCFNSGLSEMSDTSMDFLRTIIIPGDAERAGSSARDAMGSMMGFSRGSGLLKRKTEFDPFPGDKKQPRVLASGPPPPADPLRVLEQPLRESSTEDIIEAMRALEEGLFVPPQLRSVATLAGVVRDKVKRNDRFHKKKVAADFIKNPIKSLKARAMSSSDKASSGQGCTIVVVSRKCKRHPKACNPREGHSPSDFSVTKEPITRSNFGKWVNTFLKSEEKAKPAALAA